MNTDQIDHKTIGSDPPPPNYRYSAERFLKIHDWLSRHPECDHLSNEEARERYLMDYPRER